MDTHRRWNTERSSIVQINVIMTAVDQMSEIGGTMLLTELIMFCRQKKEATTCSLAIDKPGHMSSGLLATRCLLPLQSRHIIVKQKA